MGPGPAGPDSWALVGPYAKLRGCVVRMTPFVSRMVGIHRLGLGSGDSGFPVPFGRVSAHDPEARGRPGLKILLPR
jgi:hypothetical protein